MECLSSWLRISQRMICAIALVVCLSQVTVNATRKLQTLDSSNPQYLKWSEFPSDFVFGVSSAAAQIEGSANEAGKGPSVWDHYVETNPDLTKDHSNNLIAIDSYKRYKEDVKAVKDLGVDAYRFSIAWSRILPQGTLSGGINQEDIDHYNSLIDELIKNGITPYVTLLHFDPPQALVDKYGGYLSRSFVDDFKDYSELCFKTFGDRVKNWISINEPYVVAKFGYDLGTTAPGRCSNHPQCKDGGNSATEPYTVAHNLILSHATVVKLYREKFQAKQGGKIGWSLVGQYYEPYSNSTEDNAAVKRLLDFELGWFMEPIVYGDYPKSMRDMVKERLPCFTEEEKKMIKGAFDFIGINYYTSRFAQSIPPSSTPSYTNDSEVNSTEKNATGVSIGLQAPGSTYVFSYPIGLQKLLEFIKQNYQSPTIYITENGITQSKNATHGVDEALTDPERIQCIQNHLYMIKMAMKSGVNVKGYFHWALFDSWEWSEGFEPMFGLYYVDLSDNLNRIPKHSAKWLQTFLKT